MCLNEKYYKRLCLWLWQRSSLLCGGAGLFQVFFERPCNRKALAQTSSNFFFFLNTIKFLSVSYHKVLFLIFTKNGLVELLKSISLRALWPTKKLRIVVLWDKNNQYLESTLPIRMIMCNQSTNYSTFDKIVNNYLGCNLRMWLCYFIEVTKIRVSTRPAHYRFSCSKSSIITNNDTVRIVIISGGKMDYLNFIT